REYKKRPATPPLVPSIEDSTLNAEENMLPAGGPSYPEAKGGALRLARVAERWDKFPAFRVGSPSSAIRSRPPPRLRSAKWWKLLHNQSSGRSTNPRFTGFR